MLKGKLKGIVSFVLIMVIILSSTYLQQIVKADTNEDYVTLYVIDNTKEQWLKNHNAVMELIDHTNEHKSYIMSRTDYRVWSVQVPQSAYNITINRRNPDQTVCWNTWSVGGRDCNNVFSIEDNTNGHWYYVKDNNISKEKFRAGDEIYIDLSEFPEWTNDNAVFYINAGGISKDENGGNNIEYNRCPSEMFHPKKVLDKINDYTYRYIFTEDDTNISELRIWRGDSDSLWNSSCLFTIEHFLSGNNCVRLEGWDCCSEVCEYEPDIVVGPKLSVNKNEVYIGKDSNEVYFYLDGISEIEGDITLYQEDGRIVGNFYDDGNYLVNGDEIKGDGIYSLKGTVDIAVNTDTTYSFFAKFENGVCTNTITVDVIMPDIEIEIENIKYVNQCILDIMNQYTNLVERYEAVEDILSKLKLANNIVSYSYNEINQSFEGKYRNGSDFIILLENNLIMS